MSSDRERNAHACTDSGTVPATSAAGHAPEGQSSARVQLKRSLAGQSLDVQLATLAPADEGSAGTERGAAGGPDEQVLTRIQSAMAEPVQRTEAPGGGGTGGGGANTASAGAGASQQAPTPGSTGAGAAEQAPAAPTRPPLDVSSVAAGAARQAAEAMAQSADDTEYNTARLFATGQVRCLARSSLRASDNQQGHREYFFPGAGDGVVYHLPTELWSQVPPGSPKFCLIPAAAVACHLNGTNAIVVGDGGGADMKSSLIHESSHALHRAGDLLNSMVYGEAGPIVAAFESEFRAYWTQGLFQYAGQETDRVDPAAATGMQPENPRRRAGKIRSHVLANYPTIAAGFRALDPTTPAWVRISSMMGPDNGPEALRVAGSTTNSPEAAAGYNANLNGRVTIQSGGGGGPGSAPPVAGGGPATG